MADRCLGRFFFARRARLTFFAAERAAVLDGLTSHLPSALSKLPQADFSLHLDPGVLDDLTAALTESLGEPRRSFFDEVLVEQLWTDGEASADLCSEEFAAWAARADVVAVTSAARGWLGDDLTPDLHHALSQLLELCRNKPPSNALVMLVSP